MTNEEIVSKIQSGENVADNMLLLYNQNKGIIFTIARKYSGIAELDDLHQEGYIGLCEAVNHYDLSAGVKFSSYASVCIGRSMRKYIYNNNPVSMPEHTAARAIQYRQLCAAFLQRYGRKPSARETAIYLQLSDKQAASSIKAAEMDRTASLDSIISEDGETTLCDTVSSDVDIESDVLDEVQQAQLEKVLWEAVDSLPENQPGVLRKCYKENMNRRQAAESLGIKESTVRTEEQKALRELRWSKYGLHTFLDSTILSAGTHGTGVGIFKHTWTSATERVAIYGR